MIQGILHKPRIQLLALFGLSIPLSKSVSSILLALACLWLLASAVRHRSGASITGGLGQPLTLSFILFALAALVGMFLSAHTDRGAGIVMLTLSALGIYLSTSLFLNMSDDGEADTAGVLLLSCMAGMAILDLVGIYGLVKYINTEDIDIMKDIKIILDVLLPLRPMKVHQIWFGNLNAVALYMAVFTLLFSPLARMRKIKVFLYCFIALASVCLLFSLSRTAWASFLVTVPIVLFFLVQSRKIYFLAMLCAPVVFFLLYMNSYIVAERIHQMLNDISLIMASDSSSLTSLGDRVLMWKASLRIFAQHPVFGAGTGSYPAAMAELIKSGEFPSRLAAFNQPHNTYLLAAASNGMAGLAAVLFLFYRIMRSSFTAVKDRRNRLAGFLALSTGIHFFVAGFSESVLYIQMLLFTFAFVMGICLRKPARASLTMPHSAEGIC